MRMATSPNSFIQAYLDRGFGSMTKNDFEVMIFAELLQTSLLNKSNYDISVDLRIPETKVKRLRYEASLKYNILSEQDLRDKFRKAVNAANVENNKVIMTSQNHGYSIDEENITKFMRITHKNLNDDTIEGFEVASLTVYAVQFNPEGAPGSQDGLIVYDEWINIAQKDINRINEVKNER